jgi:hypothetical protein
VFGRTDKFYLKQYEDETNLICYLVLDISESMAYRGPGSGLSKLEYAQCLAAAMAWLVLHQQDAVGLVTFDQEIRANVAPSSNASHLRSLLQVMEDVQPVAKTATGPIFHELAERFRKRGVVMILSDLFDEVGSLMAGLKHFAHRRHDVILLHVLDPAELEFPFRKPHDVRRPGAVSRTAGRPAFPAESLSEGDGPLPHRSPEGMSAAQDGLPTDPHRSADGRSPLQIPGRTQRTHQIAGPSEPAPRKSRRRSFSNGTRRIVLVPFSLHEFRGKSMKCAAEETEVSPSNFVFPAETRG